MRLLFRFLLMLLAGAALLSVGGVALGYYLATRSLPDYDSAWNVEGLDAPVRVVRDSQATPHIFAETDADGFFALGWAHAEDRLWQMELSRRAAQGRLAELFGARAVSIDLSMRALDLPDAARSALAALSPEIRLLVEAYASGVNARVRAVNRRALGRGAPEFFLFGDEGFAPWTAADSVSVVKLMALRLSASARHEARRARLLSQLTAGQVEDLFPTYPGDGVLALPAFAELYDSHDFPSRQAALTEPNPLSPFPQPGRAGASNVWAVDGSRSATGAPLLASDPHLWLSAPGVWMLARITSPGFDVIGGSIPGVPAILIGRNDRIAWGLATTNLDDQDIYLERLDPNDRARYRTPGGWKRFDVRRETIRVDGADPVEATLLRSRHGPVIPPGGDLDFSAVTPAGHVAALAWTALDEEDRSVEAAIRLMQAGSIEQAEEAARLHHAPAQNIAVADENGVALIVAGAAPLRSPDSRSQGRVPSLGALAENDWVGRSRAEDAPRAIRPLSGAVANANNRVTNAPFPQHLSFDWGAPYRIRRIEQRLNARPFHSRDSFVEMQNDAVSGMARSVLPIIARDLWWGEGDGGQDGLRAEALDRLAKWNGDMSPHDPEPLIFSAWMRALTRRLAEDETGSLFPLIEGPRPLFVERVFHDVDGAARWCDVVKTPEPEDCALVARRALDDALDELSAAYGPELSRWRWGEAHRAVHRHVPLGSFGWLGDLVNIEHETGGGDHAIMKGGTAGRGAEPYANIHAAGLRAVFDFADLDRSVIVIATGQSGHPLSRRYDDLGELWRRGAYVPLSLNPEDARAGAAGVTRLSPGG